MVGSLNVFIHTLDKLLAFQGSKQLLLQADVLVNLIHVPAHRINSIRDCPYVCLEAVTKCSGTTVESCLEACNYPVKGWLKPINRFMEASDSENHAHVERRHEFSLNKIVEIVFVFLDVFARFTSMCIVYRCQEQAYKACGHGNEHTKEQVFDGFIRNIPGTIKSSDKH